MNIIDGHPDIDKLVRNYKDFCGQRSIVCDIPLQALKHSAKILSNFYSDILFLRSETKDIEYINKLEINLNRIKSGTHWKGYKRASKYINTLEKAIYILKHNNKVEKKDD